MVFPDMDSQVESYYDQRPLRDLSWVQQVQSPSEVFIKMLSNIASDKIEPGPDQNWRDWARCKGTDPEIFYPPEEDAALEAKAICAKCPVKEDCLNQAMEKKEKYGVWGGKTERERRSLRRKLGKLAKNGNGS